MKTVLLIAALSICVWPEGAFAGEPSAPEDLSGETAALSRPADMSGAKSKAFIHPDTGEILTREQWQALGVENGEADATSRPSGVSQDAPTVLQGRQIDLGNGDYVVVVDAPESEMVETKVWFDEKGKAHIRCDH